MILANIKFDLPNAILKSWFFEAVEAEVISLTRYVKPYE